VDDLLDDLLAELAIPANSSHGGGVGGVWAPLGRGSGSGLGEHLVDLLESESFCFWHKQVSVNECSSAETAPDEEDAGSEVALVLTDHVGSDDGDDGVPEPVGGGGESDTSGSDGEGEDLSDKNPCTGSPGCSEEEDEDGNEGDLSVDGSDVLGTADTVDDLELVESDGDTDDGHEELADKHTKSSIDEERSATELLNSVEGDGSGADVDDGENHGDQERIVDGAGGREERSRVVENEVYSGPLLHHLERGTENGSTEVGVGSPEGTREACSPGREPRVGGDSVSLVVCVGYNLGELELDVLGVLWLTTETGKDITSSLDAASLDKVSWRVWEEEDSGCENDTPCELNSDGNSVRARVGTVLGEVVDDGCQHDTNGDAELVARDEGTTDFSGADLGHVENDDRRDESDTDTSNETTNDDGSEGRCSKHLDDDTCEVDCASRDNGPLSSKEVGAVTGNEGSEEGTGGKDGNNERGGGG